MHIPSAQKLSQRATFFFLFLGFSLFLAFGLHHLGKFQTADEDLWIGNPLTGRVHQYWNAWSRHDWLSTRINDKPGITPAIISGSVGLLIDRHPEQKILKDTKLADTHNPTVNERTSFFFRLPILIVNGFLILLAFPLIQRLTGSRDIALFSTTFIFLSPIIIGISQIVNPDAVLWSFSFITVLAYLLYLQTLQYRYLVLATAAFGLALLSKYSAIFIALFLCYTSFLYPWFHYDSLKENLSKHFKRSLLGYIVFIFGSLLIFSLGMPAVFMDTSLLYKGTIGFGRHSQSVLPILFIILAAYTLALLDAFRWNSRYAHAILKKTQSWKLPVVRSFCWLVLGFLVFTVINWRLGNPFHLKDLAFDLGKGIKLMKVDLFENIVLQIRPLVFTLTPVMLFLALYALARAGHASARHRFFALLTSSFIIFFYAAVLAQVLLVNVRYSILLYPIVLLLAAFGLHDLLQRFQSKKVLRIGILVLVFGFAMLTLWLSKPFYFNYTSHLFPSSKTITGAWGYGGYEAAQELNKLPNAENLVAWADYDGFCPFFKGACMRGNTLKQWHADPANPPVNYFITSRRGLMLNKNLWSSLKKRGLVEEKPYWELNIGGREGNFIRIHKGKISN